jgi:hypothetical protein
MVVHYAQIALFPLAVWSECRLVGGMSGCAAACAERPCFRRRFQARFSLVAWLALASGPGLGTLGAMPVCAYWAHVVLR